MSEIEVNCESCQGRGVIEWRGRAYSCGSCVGTGKARKFTSFAEQVRENLKAFDARKSATTGEQPCMAKFKFAFVDDGDGEIGLAYLHKMNGPYKVVKDQTPSLEELADLCDLDAEDVNAHDLVGCHRLLAKLISVTQGRGVAHRILTAIAEYGGLHGMNGVCSETDAYKALGVSECWQEWSAGV